ncbi:MAG: DUF120 domain-containing protein [Thermoproteota archaeon]
MLEVLKLRGIVFSGKGEGARFLTLPEVRKQIKDKLGVIPYPGTLNIRLTEKDEFKKAALKEAEGKKISLGSGFHTGIVFEARLKNGVQCGIVIPQIPEYPEDVIEVIAPTELREDLKLEDGDLLEIDILIE